MLLLKFTCSFTLNFVKVLLKHVLVITTKSMLINNQFDTLYNAIKVKLRHSRIM